MDRTPLTQHEVITVKSYVFPIHLEEEDDGRWSAWIDTLPGCAAWGYTKEEALQAIHDAAQAYVDDMLEAGEALPTEGVVVVDAPVVTVTHGT
jgi:predicted RNase H-like HicB family nuclease